jgi:ADP-ribosylglycohydrolase
LFTSNSHITDDSLLTIAVADHLMTGRNLVDLFHDMVHEYPAAGFGLHFFGWGFHRNREPYNSWGNGSAMRVSPVGFAASSLDEALDMAKRTAVVTHNHPEGIKGAQATAASVFLARTSRSKMDIRTYVTNAFGYDLTRSLDEIRPEYAFDVSCQGSVPESIIAFLESDDFEGAVRNAVSLGGDADTMGCIAGGIAEAFYGEVPVEIRDRVWGLLDSRLKVVIREFYAKFGLGTL